MVLSSLPFGKTARTAPQLGQMLARLLTASSPLLPLAAPVESQRADLRGSIPPFLRAFTLGNLSCYILSLPL